MRSEGVCARATDFAEFGLIYSAGSLGHANRSYGHNFLSKSQIVPFLFQEVHYRPRRTWICTKKREKFLSLRGLQLVYGLLVGVLHVHSSSSNFKGKDQNMDG